MVVPLIKLTKSQERDSASSISSKRQRRTPAPDITHISDSMKVSQSQMEDLRAALRKAEQNLAQETKARTAAEELVTSKEKQLEELKLSLGNLQTRYETRMKSSHQLKREHQKLQMEKEAIEKRQEKLSADNLVLKEQLAQLQTEAGEAREALKAGGGIAGDLEIAKEEVRRLTEKNLSLEKSSANTRKDFEFTRSQYQEASTKAAEFAMQISELESQITDLKRQASDEKRRLKELNYKNDLEQHLARVLNLELMLKNRDTMLQRKEEELKALRKGRGVATRGSSVQPGSPRPAGSRAGSPAPGLLAPSTHAVNRASALRHER
jgi:chromosome segregation ATPase